jgi:hypothetical protein
MNKIIYLLLVFVFLISDTITAQRTLRINGKLINSFDSSPVIFANIRLASTFKGTVSNEEGGFEIIFDDTLRQIKLLISHLNFNDTSIIIQKSKFIKGSYDATIILNQSTNQLNEITISSNSPLALLREAKNNLKNIYDENPFTCETYYKETIKENDTDVRYTDAIINMYVPSIFKGGNNPKQESVKMEVISHRTETGPHDSLVDVCQSPYNAVANMFVNIIPDDTSSYNYKFSSFMDGDYLIDVIPKEKNNSAKFTFRFTVNSNSKAIKNIKFYFSDDVLSKYSSGFTKRNDKNSSSQFTVYYTEIGFIPYGDKWNVSFVHNHVKEILTNHQKNYSLNIDRHIYLFVTNIYLADWKIRSKNILKANEYLHKEKRNKVLEDEFWNNHNKIKETSIDLLIKQQLSTESSLK